MITFPWIWPLMFLAFMAFGLSTWLTVQTSGVNRLPGCSEGSGCAALAASRWSRWTVFPVAAVGAMLYLILGTLLALWVARSGTHHPDLSAQMIVGVSVVLAGAAIWFVLLQVAVVRRVCIYCNLIHVMGISIFAIMMFSTVHGDFAVGARGVLTWTGKPILAGLGCLLLLVGGQLLWRPKTYAIIPASRTPGFCASREHEFSIMPPDAENGTTANFQLRRIDGGESGSGGLQ